MKLFLGIDWGGTYIKAGIVDSKGKIIKRIVYSSENLRRKQIFIRELQSLLGKLKDFRIEGVGIGAPGIINLKKGFIYYLPNIPGWKNYPLRDVLKQELKLPVFINNDANVFALAESRYGAAKGKKRAIFLTLGTGLGGAVIFRGKLLEGDVSASELGHVAVSLKGKSCGCGASGCIETYTGNSYILRRYRQLKGSQAGISQVKDIYKKALAGDNKALKVWKEFSYNLGRFLAGMVNIFNPEVIVLGGGISGAFQLFKPLVLKTIKSQAMWPQVKGLKLVKAKLKHSGIIGASLLVKEGLNN